MKTSGFATLFRLAVLTLVASTSAWAQSFTATLTPSATTYGAAAGTITYTLTINYPTVDENTITQLGFQLDYPASWTYGTTGGTGLGDLVAKPRANDTGSMAFAFDTYPAAQESITFTAKYPAGLSGDQIFRNIVLLYKVGSDGPTLSVPLTNVTITPIPAAPAITTHPVSQTVNPGVTTTFTVVATGSPTPTYQWRKDTGDISGATSATYSIVNTQAADAASYDVVVTNTGGSVTSNAATLAVNSAPAISTQPASQTAIQGTSVTFSVVATGTPTLTYQWRKGASNLGGQTAASLTLSNVQTSDAGAYNVVVTNGVSSVTSSDATLTVTVPPTITTQPTPVTVTADQTATFSVVATGTPAPSYQWQRNTQNLTGGTATSATLSLTNVAAGDSGSYRVVVTNTAGNVTSDAVALTVNTLPEITTQPAATQTANEGGSASFSVVATGTPTPTYQWRKGTTPIPGETGASLTLTPVQPGFAGSDYNVVVTNSVGSVTSNNVTLNVTLKPAITTQPTSQTVNAGQSATFTVVATGTSPTYQWFKGSTSLGAGATSASLTLPSVGADDAADYTVVVSTGAGNVTSSVATLSVNLPPTITTQPSQTSVAVGGTANFTVAASGTAPFTYQWRKGTSNIDGATTATLTLNNVQLAYAGSDYNVVVTNVVTSTTSSNATLIVTEPPAITSAPSAQTVNAGQTATFTVVATGSPAPTYQWQKNTVNIDGATSATLSLTNVASGDAASYRVVVTNSTGSVTTTAVTLTVNFAPQITTQPTNVTQGVGGTAQFSVVATGLPTPTYQWQKGTAPLAGETGASLSLSNVQLSDSGSTYSVVVTNSVSSVTSNVVTLTVNQGAAITSQPTSQTVTEGGTASFTVVAIGTPAPGYQWQKDGSDLPGETSATLTLNNVSRTAAGTYKVKVGNGVGSVESTAVTLTVDYAPEFTTQPTNQTQGVGGIAVFTAVATGHPAPTYQWFKGTAPISGETGATLSLASVQVVDTNTTYHVVATNSLGSATSTVVTLTVNQGPAIATQPASQTKDTGESVTFTVVANGNPTPSYQWKKDNVVLTGQTGASLTINPVAKADAGTYLVVVSNIIGSVDSAAATLTVNFAPTITTEPADQSQGIGGKADFTVVATGLPAPTYQWQKGTADIADATAATLSLSNVQLADSGSTYRVVITNRLGSVTSKAATLTVTEGPAIATPPTAQTVNVGQTATFTVAATGSPAPTYQWQKGTENIVGATGAILTLENVAATAAGSYRVILSNSVGTIASVPVTLTVNFAPAITTQPLSQTQGVGGTAQFSVVATGLPTPTYQWKKGVADIVGATSATLSLADLSLADSGSTYSVVVTNSVGAVTSSVATLTVNQGPAITSQPTNQTVNVGQSASFTVVATGTPPPSYQWFKGDATISGATNATFSIGSVSLGDVGSYKVVVTNTAGSTTSSVATLALNATPVAITTQPADATVLQGASVSFSVVATGTAPLTYVWSKGGSVITGATAATFTLPAVTTADAGGYSVTVTNPAGPLTSRTATLVVNVLPSIVTPPVSKVVTAGESASFTVVAGGTAPLTYQWAKNGTAISGATAATFSIASTATTDTGSYTCTVTNVAGTATATATLTVNPAVFPPAISSASTAAVAINTAFSYQIAASNSPTSFTATGLPAGLTVSATGLISGSPTAAGVFPIALSATNSGGTGTATLTLTVVQPVPVITSGGAASGRVGVAFTYTVTATNTPTSFAATGLPAGLSITTITGAGSGASTGAITGSPTAAGTFTVNLTASNAAGSSASFPLTLTIAQSVSVPVVTSAPSATGKVGDGFTYQIAASNTPTSFAATNLPAGLAVNTATGAITGSPTAAGTFTMTVSAANSAGSGPGLAITVTIASSASAPVITSSTSAAGTAGSGFTYQIAATNTPTSFGATGLPAGLTVNTATGAIAGSPTSPGDSTVVLTATNAAGTGTATLVLSIAPGLSAPTIGSSSTASGKVGVTFNYPVLASNSPTAFAATGVPAGLALNTATGILSGTPTSAGTFTVTLTASNAAGAGAPFTLTVTIAAAATAPQITSAATATGTSGALFTYEIKASNGPLTGFGATGLPGGLALNPLTGVITGTPSAAGLSTVSITASNAVGTSSPLALLINVQAAALAPVITSSLTAVGTQNAAFTYQVTASNLPAGSPLPPGNGFAATGLPAGLAINAGTGVISGTPTVTGTFPVSLTAFNDVGTSAASFLSITINPSPTAPVITSGNTAGATAAAAFAYQITASNSPTVFDAAGRPAWLAINTGTGALTGTPTAPGVFTVKLSAGNAAGTSAQVSLAITVAPAVGSPIVTSGLGASGSANAAFTYGIVASNGPVTAYGAANLPGGLALDPNSGVISGTPTIPGTYEVAIHATNAIGIGGAKILTIVIAAAPGSPVVGANAGALSDEGRSALALRHAGQGDLTALAAVALQSSATVGVPYSFQITASGSPTAFSATGLPSGLAVNPATGLISGAPAVAGTFDVLIRASNGIGVGASATLVLTVNPPATTPTLTSAFTASGTAGAAFTYTATANNSPTSFNASNLPPGLSLNATSGALTGTPTAPGTYKVKLSANNSVGTGPETSVTVTIAAAAGTPAVSSAATASGTVGVAFSYQLAASNTPTAYAASGLPPGVSLNLTTGAVSGTPVADGEFKVTVSASNATGAGAPATLTITIVPPLTTPSVTSSASASVTVGTTFAYATSATNAPTSYNITNLPAGLTANSATGLINGVPTTSGTFTIKISANNASGTGAALSLVLEVVPVGGTPGQPGGVSGSRLINISTRAFAGTGDKVLIAGFVVTGTEAKPVMIRAVGPTLAGYGVTGVLADPTLELYRGPASLLKNDNWGSAGDAATIAATATRVGAFALPAGSAEAVIYTTLQPGLYSTIVRGTGTTTGVALVEIYDASESLPATAPRLVNISSRGDVGTGPNVLIAGFVINGDVPKQVLMRGVGPALTPVGVSGALVDPKITVLRGGVTVDENDNWGSAGNAADLAQAASTTGAFALTNGSKDAALLVTLAPGAYSVTVTGVAGTTGIALVEVYEMP